jgi:hypothetical protein
MTISNLLSSEPMQGHFAAMQITDGDFHRMEVIGDFICRIEIVDDEDDKVKWPEKSFGSQK